MKNHKQSRKSSESSWDKEYRSGKHIALSAKPSEDLIKFTRYLERRHGRTYLNPKNSVLDLGCGNGRNLIYLASVFGMKGLGYDISSEAIKLARSQSANLPIQCEIRSITGKLPLPGGSQTIVLDIMTSHFLGGEELRELHEEIARVLRPGGWLFWKTFLLDEDRHAKRLLREHPGKEAGSYIHPKLKIAERVLSEAAIIDSIKKCFAIHKLVKSQRHREKEGGKRRSISVYAQKNPEFQKRILQ